MAYSELKLKPQFEDDTVGDDLIFGPFATNAAAITNAKTNIIAFNETPDGDISYQEVSFTTNFVNADDSSFKRWSEAHIITTNVTKIF